MPVYEYECPEGHYQKVICGVHELRQEIPCHCGKTARRIFTPSGAFIGNMDDTTWAKVTAQALDSRSKDPVVVEARTNPTKGNVMKALKKLGLRYVERGERERKQETEAEFRARTKPEFMREWRRLHRIEVHS